MSAEKTWTRIQCPTCVGRGQLFEFTDESINTEECHDCNGTGRVWLSPKGEISKYLGDNLVEREKST